MNIQPYLRTFFPVLYTAVEQTFFASSAPGAPDSGASSFTDAGSHGKNLISTAGRFVPSALHGFSDFWETFKYLQLFRESLGTGEIGISTLKLQDHRIVVVGEDHALMPRRVNNFLMELAAKRRIALCREGVFRDAANEARYVKARVKVDGKGYFYGLEDEVVMFFSNVLFIGQMALLQGKKHNAEMKAHFLVAVSAMPRYFAYVLERLASSTADKEVGAVAERMRQIAVAWMDTPHATMEEVFKRVMPFESFASAFLKTKKSIWVRFFREVTLQAKDDAIKHGAPQEFIDSVLRPEWDIAGDPGSFTALLTNWRNKIFAKNLWSVLPEIPSTTLVIAKMGALHRPGFIDELRQRVVM